MDSWMSKRIHLCDTFIATCKGACFDVSMIWYLKICMSNLTQWVNKGLFYVFIWFQQCLFLFTLCIFCVKMLNECEYQHHIWLNGQSGDWHILGITELFGRAFKFGTHMRTHDVLCVSLLHFSWLVGFQMLAQIFICICIIWAPVNTYC